MNTDYDDPEEQLLASMVQLNKDIQQTVRKHLDQMELNDIKAAFSMFGPYLTYATYKDFEEVLNKKNSSMVH